MIKGNRYFIRQPKGQAVWHLIDSDTDKIVHTYYDFNSAQTSCNLVNKFG